MASPKRCPGCRYSIKHTQQWCALCEKRLPSHLAESVHQNKTAFEAAVSQHRAGLDQAVQKAIQWLEQHPPISEVDMGIIRALAVGQETEEIAAELGVAPQRVRERIRQVCQRWGCRSRAQLMIMAVEKNYLKVEVNV